MGENFNIRVLMYLLKQGTFYFKTGYILIM